MTTVTLATHCHNRDLPRLHALGELENLIEGHNYPFDEAIVVHQRCSQYPYRDIPGVKIIDIADSDYPAILSSVGIPHKDPKYSEITHGWDGPHYYEHHCVNHITEMQSATSDYILFTDADCRIVSQPDGQSWVTKAIEILENHPQVLIVSPSDGGQEYVHRLVDGTRLTNTVSQQIFLANRKRMLEVDFTNLQWDGNFDAPYGPFQEFYVLWEGWMYRWMKAHNLYRAVLPEQWRYWHGEYH